MGNLDRSTNDDANKLPPQPVLEWVAQFGQLAECVRVTQHPWAETYKLISDEGDKAFLKILAPSTAESGSVTSELSDVLSPHVPRLIGSSPEFGLYLYADHQGRNLGKSITAEERKGLLNQYAGVQAMAMRRPDFLEQLPRVFGVAEFDRFEALLRNAQQGRAMRQTPGNPFLAMPASELEAYVRFFSKARGHIRTFLSASDHLPVALEHGDLRSANVARREDGSYCFFDWDDACAGPLGLSLHSQFRGCSRIYAAVLGQGRSEDHAVLEAYVDRLVTAAALDRSELMEGIPAAACAGVFRFISGFAPFPVKAGSTQDAISSNIRKRLSDMMDMFVMLANNTPEFAEDFAIAFEQAGRTTRPKLLQDSVEMPKAHPQHNDATFPQIDLPDLDVGRRKISKKTRNHAVEIFKRDGALLIPNAIPLELIEACHAAFADLHEEHQKTIEGGGALRVGNKRFMISLELSGPFSHPDLLASPFVLPVLQKLLSDEMILGSLTAVASLPGAAEQRLHRDNPALFGEARDLQTPSFSIAMIVPLIPLTKETGATRIMKRSHTLRSAETEGLALQEPEVSIGSCYLMDSRLYHQGMANQSEYIRPILSLVYQRPWYRDPENFKKQQPLIISENHWPSLDENVKSMTRWAVEDETGPKQ